MTIMTRWPIPVVGPPVTLEAHWAGTITRVEAAGDDTVEFWVPALRVALNLRPRTFMVVGTGHEIPSGWDIVGTTQRTPSGFVWHLLEKMT